MRAESTSCSLEVCGDPAGARNRQRTPPRFLPEPHTLAMFQDGSTRKTTKKLSITPSLTHVT